MKRFASETSHIDDVYDNWFSRFHSIIDKYIPNKIVTIRPRDKPWMTYVVIKAIRKGNILFKHYCKAKTNSLWQRYKDQRNLATSLIRDAKNLYYQKLNTQLSDPCMGPKKWWSYVKSILSPHHRISIRAILENAAIVSDPQEKAKLFNEYFVSQAKVNDLNHQLPPYPVTCFTDKIFSVIQVTEQEVQNLLNKVDISKASGHDVIGNKIIKLCSRVFTRLINLSLQDGKYPTEWKKANISPIFIKDNCQLKNNYRPISLLPSISKIPEKLVFTKLCEFLL